MSRAEPSCADYPAARFVSLPGSVQASFNEVNQAQQEKERLINEARRLYNQVIPWAEGEKDKRIREANG